MTFGGSVTSPETWSQPFRISGRQLCHSGAAVPVPPCFRVVLERPAGM